MYDRLQFLCEMETRQYHIIDNGRAACKRAVCTASVKCREARSKLVVEVLSLLSIATVDTEVKHHNSRMNLFLSSFERATTVCKYVCLDEVSA